MLNLIHVSKSLHEFWNTYWWSYRISAHWVHRYQAQCCKSEILEFNNLAILKAYAQVFEYGTAYCSLREAWRGSLQGSQGFCSPHPRAVKSHTCCHASSWNSARIWQSRRPRRHWKGKTSFTAYKFSFEAEEGTYSCMIETVWNTVLRLLMQQMELMKFATTSGSILTGLPGIPLTETEAISLRWCGSLIDLAQCSIQDLVDYTELGETRQVLKIAIISPCSCTFKSGLQ